MPARSIKGSEPGNGWSWALNLALQGYEVWCLTNVEDRDATQKELQQLGCPISTSCMWSWRSTSTKCC